MAWGPSWAAARSASNPSDPIASGQVCLTCHAGNSPDAPAVPTAGGEKPGFAIWHTKHWTRGDGRTPAANGGCAACHGELGQHITNPKAAKPTVLFGPEVPAEEQNRVCSGCHKGGQHIFWVGSTHERNDVTCVSCHKPHEAKDQVLVTETQAGVCFTCHKDVRAAMFKPSSHPLREGRMACTSCHQPHGSPAPHQMARNTVNETCYQCHAEKRGPFLWEHPPARENCAECHTPHGSVYAPMLKARGPYLCQQCHLAQFHPSTAYSGRNLPGGAAAPAFDKMLGQQCANCHPKVHGTNHPSGARFTR